MALGPVLVVALGPVVVLVLVVVGRRESEPTLGSGWLSGWGCRVMSILGRFAIGLRRGRRRWSFRVVDRRAGRCRG